MSPPLLPPFALPPPVALLHRRRLLLAAAAGLAVGALPFAGAHAEAVRSFYVAPNGSDSAAGTSNAPWRTVNRAVRDLRPGDEVVVRPGTYTEQVYVQRGGDADRAGQRVIIRAETQGAAKLRAPSGAYSTIVVRANYVVIDGFDAVGGDGHAVDIESCHHIVVRNCTVHDSGGGGVAAARAEFITIDNNVAYNNSATNQWHTSGLSIYQCRNISGDTTTTGYRCFVRNNISYGNLQRWGNNHTDGNGIIIDDYQSTQTEGFPNYTYPTLVENNLCHSNGGKGIHVYLTDNVTVRNNTCWRNNLDPNNPGTWRSELSNVNARNNRWYNNIGMADPQVNPNNTALGNQSYGGVTNNGTTWNNNLTFNGTNGQASLHITSGNATPRSSDGNKLGVNPRFVNAARSGFDFRVQSGSPAIDAGTAAFGLPAKDLAGRARAQGTVDIGAYEHGAPASQPTAPEPSEPPVTEPPATEPPVTEPPATEPPPTQGSTPPRSGFSFAERARRFESLFGRNPTFGANTPPPVMAPPAPTTPPSGGTPPLQTPTFPSFGRRLTRWRSRF